MQIGPHKIANKLVLAPMAGVTDRPFRQMCKDLGAGMAVSEMVGSTSLIRGSAKTLRRARHDGETAPRSVQIVGYDPAMMAEAARINEAMGAEIIDINMGCPAKKVCKMMSGSSLLRDEPLVAAILEATVKAVKIPVTLKIRTGWSPEMRNGPTIAQIAEASGIQALSVHGRTRNCFFKGEAEYETIAKIKQSVSIPIIANGDIDTPQKAKYVLEQTGADAIMIGRAAQGRPWIFREINHYLEHGTIAPEPELAEIEQILSQHLENLYEFYDEYIGVLMARKHVSWYSKGQPNGGKFRDHFNRIETAVEQRRAIKDFFAEVNASSQ
ncbi:MAG TPA: tRNA dihydrouridine synthase DusB [Gammaproteobacteria bacterium]|nr:tRNA dihydrouridine synthase DusB [Gammaproteobacteria bacterium]